MSILRDYQGKASDLIIEEFKDHSSTLLVFPTGTGKTTVFADVVRRFLPKRSLVLVHREELAFQAHARIEQDAGVECQIEMADLRASTSLFSRSPCVIASVATLHRRLEQFRPEDFGLLIADECHHSTAATWRKIIDHFRQNKDLKVLGVTATPDRTDEEALGQVFESVAMDYEILDAIRDGWLVPIDQQFVTIGGLDFSNVRVTAGDLNQADLAAVMEDEQHVQGMVGSAIELISDKATLLFASSVRHAEMACEIFNRHRSGMAGFICGSTESEQRRSTLADFKSGELQVLCNVGIATEGFDAPNAEIILNGRPTKSRALYAQIAGRVLRPLPGIVDGLTTPEERRAAIAASIKPAAKLFDYVGNSGRHKLMSSADILGGNVSDEAIEMATRKAKASGKPVRMDELLNQSEEEIRDRIEKARLAEEARKAKVIAKVRFVSSSVNPFDVFDLSPVRERGWDQGKKLSEKQRALLLKQGIDGDKLPYAQAKALINETFRRWNGGLCTFKQAKLLKKHGYNTKNMTMKEASSKIDALVKNGWKRPAEPSPVAGVPLDNFPTGKRVETTTMGADTEGWNQ